LIGGEPIAQADSKAPNAFHSPNAGGEFGTEKAGISGLVGDPADGGQPQVDRRGRVMTLLQVNAIAQNHRPVEREARLRTVPFDELADRVVVRPLTAGRCEAVQHCRLGVFEVGQGQHPLRRLLLAGFRFRHR